MRVRLTCISIALCLCACAHDPAHQRNATVRKAEPITRPHSETPQWWFDEGARTAAALRGGAKPRARNIILFLGDGMSITTITAARILEGQRRGAPGEETRLAFEEFPYTALSRTYAVDAQTADSASTMSAIMSGIKTRYDTVSLTQDARPGDCASTRGNDAATLLEIAESSGLATGVVTTTRITDATPAATYAHSADDNWEADADMPVEARNNGCLDIARQLIEFSAGDGVDVAFGGGRSRFLPTNVSDPEYPELRGKRLDGRNLIAEFEARKGSRFVWNAQQFNALDPSSSKQVMGLFEPENLQYTQDRAQDAAGAPSLAQMTTKAIALLSRHSEGYVLVVEGGRIDHAHHSGNAYRALDETIGLSDAVRAAVAATRADETLILATADHSHTLSFSGSSVRGNPILGLARSRNRDGNAAEQASEDAAGRPFTTLNYANGPGYLSSSDAQAAGPKHYPHVPKKYSDEAVTRPNLGDIDTANPDYLQESIFPMRRETHSGEDVAVYARGPGAEAVHGSLEQNVLFHLMLQANPPMRAHLCRINPCEGSSIPVQRPRIENLPMDP